MSTPKSHVHVQGRRVLLAATMTLLAGVVEIWIARRAGSLFLVADAVHLFAHLGIFGVLLVPLGRRHAAREDAITCAVLLMVIAIASWIAFRCVTTLIVGESAPPAGALLFSLLGLAANLIAAWLLRDPAAERWSFRVALAHELSDASLTVAGLLGAGAIALYGFRWIDPALSLGIVLWLFAWAGRLLLRRIRSGPGVWSD